MRSTYHGAQRSTGLFGTHPRAGLTDPAVIAAYVTARIEDPSLLSRRAEPSYADFFSTQQA
ncbi:hypothetical protein [Curtobacterium sp. 9128]|uniref:hypothetical protein n=1 Tax=Curtobacterium sp. 9128 TaxID=1793722 RepID=UPI0011A9F043|nr:hypothetical protein [Curtobacterium sp. 9128]